MPGKPDTRRLNVWVSEEAHANLAKIAAATGRPKCGVVDLVLRRIDVQPVKWTTRVNREAWEEVGD